MRLTYRDIRQSPQYANYLKLLGWQVEPVDKWQAFIRQFPLVGSFIKVQRIDPPIPTPKIARLAKHYRAFRVIVELRQEGEFKDLRLGDSPYAPSKTIHIDLKSSEEEIFMRFTKAKQRAVRKALKNGLTTKESTNIYDFIKLKLSQDRLFGFFLKKDFLALWSAFSPAKLCLLLACHRDKPVAGVLILWHDQMAYYWSAAATEQGKKLFAPTLLVWEALKLSKKRGCKVFDFEGVYDERFPQATKNWQGFTKFKEGFGGMAVRFPPPLIIK